MASVRIGLIMIGYESIDFVYNGYVIDALKFIIREVSRSISPECTIIE